MHRVVPILVSAVYDTNELVALYTVKARQVLKNIWRLSGQQRDDNLPDYIVENFVEWIEELTKLTEITIPTSFSDEQAEKVELHVFSDKSQDVFSSVAFLRRKMTSGSQSRTELAFVFGKARGVPMKPFTIPKLEISAALSRSANKRDASSVGNTSRTNVYVD